METETETDNEKTRTPLEQFAGIELGPGPAIGPGGAIAGPIGAPPPIPAATPTTFVCLRGPCRHYWEIQTHMDSGNPAETWDAEIGLKDEAGQPIAAPRAVTRTCIANPGHETDLTDDNVYACNRWEPMTPREVRARAKRQAKHLKLHPDHR